MAVIAWNTLKCIWTINLTSVDTWRNIETKLAADALFKLSKYLPLRVLVPVNNSLVYSYLQYAIINRGNFAKSFIHKLQVGQHRIVKILCKRCSRKTRLFPSHQKFQFLRINEIYKSELTKWAAVTENYFLLRIKFAKPQPSAKASVF